MMTLEQFLAALKEDVAVKWWITPLGRIRTHETCSCPVVLVANRKKGDPNSLYGNGDWREAAEYIGLERKIAQDVVSAADEWDEYKPEMRDALLNAIQVTPYTPEGYDESP